MILIREFIPALKCVSHSMGKNDVRYYLNGVHFDFSPEVLTLTASDGHRASRISLRVAKGLTYSCIIEDASIKQIIDTFKPAKRDDRELSFEREGESLFVSDGRAKIKLAVVDGKFPDLNKVIPTDEPKGAPSFGLNGEYLADAAKALSLVSNSKYHGVKMETWSGSTVMRLSCCTDRIAALIGSVEIYIMPMRL